MADVKELVTTGYDLADKALDKLHFVSCALVSMENAYSDNVANGLLEIMTESTDEVKRYIDAARDALLGNGAPQIAAE